MEEGGEIPVVESREKVEGHGREEGRVWRRRR